MPNLASQIFDFIKNIPNDETSRDILSTDPSPFVNLSGHFVNVILFYLFNSKCRESVNSIYKASYELNNHLNKQFDKNKIAGGSQSEPNCTDVGRAISSCQCLDAKLFGIETQVEYCHDNLQYDLIDKILLPLEYSKQHAGENKILLIFFAEFLNTINNLKNKISTECKRFRINDDSDYNAFNKYLSYLFQIKEKVPSLENEIITIGHILKHDLSHYTIGHSESWLINLKKETYLIALESNKWPEETLNEIKEEIEKLLIMES